MISFNKIYPVTCMFLMIFGSILSPSASADDTSSDAPVGFSEVVDDFRGVLLRVPVNPAGEENTDAAEMKFYSGDRSALSSDNLSIAWALAKTVKEDEVLLGQNSTVINPDSDSSTWGWYYWRWSGWQYPYYYTYYRPTFYYYSWYTYRYLSYWNTNYYRYYYYWY